MSEINIDAETLREDLMIEISKLTKEGRFVALLIKSTGFSFSSIAQIDCMVTLVDAPHFSTDSCSQEHLKDRKQQLHNEDERTIVDLLTEQVEFANIIVINKIHCVSKTY
jgi:G3E family GTPase